MGAKFAWQVKRKRATGRELYLGRHSSLGRKKERANRSRIIPEKT